MSKSKTNNNQAEKKVHSDDSISDDLFIRKHNDEDEIASDGSASAFDETEQVNDDNFDLLSEK